MKIYIAAICIAVFSTYGLARPISYPEGLTLMQMNDAERNSLHFHYSPTANYSIGYRGEYWREAKWQLHALQFNYLAKRWNSEDSQANLYLKSGLGFTRDQEDETNEAAFAGLAFDWEDRRYFASYENRFYHVEADNHSSTGLNNFSMHSARLGIAPYIGQYGELHTWIMLQTDYFPDKQDKTLLTPMVRFFKSQYLVELGVSEEKDVMFNFIIRY
jgi:hypothetical protein